MYHRRSLSRRIAIAFAQCVAVLSVAWGLAFFSAIRLSEDRVLTRQLQVAAGSYPDLTTSLRGYDEVSGLPESLREWAQTGPDRSEEHTSELQSRPHLVCRLLLEKKNNSAISHKVTP